VAAAAPVARGSSRRPRGAADGAGREKSALDGGGDECACACERERARACIYVYVYIHAYVYTM